MSIADELITRGWWQGSLQRGTEDPVCILGAAACVYGPNRSPWDGYELAEQAPGVLRALQLAIGLKCEANDDRAVYQWNDNPQRTFDEVLRVAKVADEILGQ